MRLALFALAAVGFSVASVSGAAAGDAGLYGHHGHRTVILQHHAPRHGGPNEDSYLVERDDRGVVACYDATYYPARYRVDPQGRHVRGSRKHLQQVDSNRYVVRRSAPVYIETRTRIKEDYVSLRRSRCN